MGLRAGHRATKWPAVFAALSLTGCGAVLGIGDLNVVADDEAGLEGGLDGELDASDGALEASDGQLDASSEGPTLGKDVKTESSTTDVSDAASSVDSPSGDEMAVDDASR